MNFLAHDFLCIPRLVLLCYLTIAASLTYALAPEKPIYEQNTVSAELTDSSERVILVIGDSISAGFGIDPKKGWVELLRNSLNQNKTVVAASKFHIINASISGDTTTGGRSRLAGALKKYQPDLVIIELGGNDGMRGTPIKNIAGNLSSMVTASQTSGAKVMLLGMRIPPNYGERYTDEFVAIFSKLAKVHDTLFVPFLLKGVAGEKEMMQADGIHPTEPGQPIMEEMVRQKMQPWLKH